MSKIGKQPIAVPPDVAVSASGQEIMVKGPKGALKRTLPPGFSVLIEDSVVSVVPPKKSGKYTAALWGTYRKHLANMVEGVEKGFTKTLEFEGIGYRAEVSGKDLALSVGFTHPVKMPISEGLMVEVQKNTIVVSGYDKEAVGQFAAVVRSIRPPEPYKGTGIRYQGEVIRRKAGKKLAGSGK
jgi:large subunit ribosomal protein L6